MRERLAHMMAGVIATIIIALYLGCMVVAGLLVVAAGGGHG